MKIQVIVVGYNRSLKFCVESIKSNVLDQIYPHDPNVDIKFFLSISRQTVKNLRSGEIIEDSHDVEVLKNMNYFYKIIDQDVIDSKIDELHSTISKNGLGWPNESFEVNDQSLTNSLRFLWLLDYSSSYIDNEADWVVLLRPDLFYKEKIDFKRYFNYKNLLIIPEWDNYAGFNDRLAIIPQKFVKKYFQRLKIVPNFILTKKSFNPEEFLKFALADVFVGTILTEKANRVRSKGVWHNEYFSESKNSGKFFYGGVRDMIRLKVLVGELKKRFFFS